MPIRNTSLSLLASCLVGSAALFGTAQAQTAPAQPPAAPAPPPQAQTVQVIQSLSGEEISGFLQNSGLTLEPLEMTSGWGFRIAANEALGYPDTLLTGETCTEDTNRCSVMVFTTIVPNAENKMQLLQVLNSYNANTTLTRAVYNPEIDRAYLEYPVVLAGGVTLSHLNMRFSSWPEFWQGFRQLTGVTTTAPAAPEAAE